MECIGLALVRDHTLAKKLCVKLRRSLLGQRLAQWILEQAKRKFAVVDAIPSLGKDYIADSFKRSCIEEELILN